MQIGLIGMSGAGKTSLALKLAAAGFEHIDCDRLIAAKLSAELDQPLVTVDDLGAWLGFPFEAGFRDKEARYLECEIAVLREIAERLAHANGHEQNLVIDMSGSAIYIGKARFFKLRRLMTVVYLAVPREAHARMLQEYLRRPRPIIWRGRFRPARGETQAAALARCYPKLIAFRERRYEALCDLQLDSQPHQRSELGVEHFLRFVRETREKVTENVKHKM
jgi:shikimate kinase